MYKLKNNVSSAMVSFFFFFFLCVGVRVHRSGKILLYTVLCIVAGEDSASSTESRQNESFASV